MILFTNHNPISWRCNPLLKLKSNLNFFSCNIFFLILAILIISEVEHAYSSSNSEFNLAFVGDWGCTEDTKKTVESIQSHDPEIVFSLGDTSYGLDINCWLDIVDPISSNMKAVIGNHDVIVPNILYQYMDKFNITNQYYSFDEGSLHFLIMSSEFLYRPDSEQFKFIESDLINNSKNPKTKWTIVLSHRQQYSSQCGSHESCDPIKKLREIYHPLFEKYKVDLLISGHSHNYQRTYPLFYNNINSSEPIFDDKKNKNFNSPKGMIQIVVGTGGIDRDRFSNLEPFIVYQDDSTYGFLNLEVSPEQDELRGIYYANNGTKMDEFVITK
ncbi:MAG: metallophosphoesterase [Nitrososphaeraceae archaeon]